jgi:hypothetical protein
VCIAVLPRIESSISPTLHFRHHNERAGARRAAAAPNSIREAQGSNLDPKTEYPYWFSSMPPDKMGGQ